MRFFILILTIVFLFACFQDGEDSSIASGLSGKADGAKKGATVTEECKAATLECFNNAEDFIVAEACGDSPDSSTCVSSQDCPKSATWTAMGILEDVQFLCNEMCSSNIEYLSDCMGEKGAQEKWTQAAALKECVAKAGCKSNICKEKKEICSEAKTRFDEERAAAQENENTETPEQTPEEITMEGCRDQVLECFNNAEDFIVEPACKKNPDYTVCIDDSYCPAGTLWSALGIEEDVSVICDNM